MSAHDCTIPWQHWTGASVRNPLTGAAARATGEADQDQWPVWVTLAVFAVVLVLLLAAVLGILLAVIAWFGRGVQVRAGARRNRKV